MRLEAEQLKGSGLWRSKDASNISRLVAPASCIDVNDWVSACKLCRCGTRVAAMIANCIARNSTAWMSLSQMMKEGMRQSPKKDRLQQTKACNGVPLLTAVFEAKIAFHSTVTVGSISSVSLLRPMGSSVTQRRSRSENDVNICCDSGRQDKCEYVAPDELRNMRACSCNWFEFFGNQTDQSPLRWLDGRCILWASRG